MGSERDSKLEDVLAGWFLAADRGEEADLEELCGGDAELVREARELIDSEPSALRFAGQEAEAEAGEPLPGDEGVPEVLGDFHLLGLLGRGGMGTVYLAEQETPRRRVALKVVELERMGGRHRRLRFEREANLAASLEHPNIVPVYAIGEQGGVAYIAMKRLRGPSLSDLELPLEPREVARLGVRIARALEEAHQCGVVHRDVKPSNVLLDGDEPVLVDFGLSRSFSDATITAEGSVAGTLPYLAPELLQEEAPRLDPRVDVYALGATLYELVSGAAPFPPEESSERLITRILLEEPAALGLRGENRDLETILLKALEKDPQRRIGSAERLAQELEHFLAGRPTTLKRIGPLTRMGRRVRRHRRTSAVGAVGVLVLLGLGSWNLRARNREALALDLDLVLAGAELEAGRAGRALALLEGPLDLHADDSRVLDLARRAEARAALDGVMNLVIDVPSAIDPAMLRASVERLESADASELPVAVRGLSLVLARWYLEDAEAALEELERLPELHGSRAAQALGYLMKGDEAWRLDGTVEHPDEHLLAATAMSLGGRPFESPLAEIRSANLLAPGHLRARYAEALAFANGGRRNEAISILGDLLATDFPTRLSRRQLVRMLLMGGELAVAERQLDALPVEEWSIVEATYALGLLYQNEDWPRFDQELQRLRRRFEDPGGEPAWSLLRKQAEAEKARGRLEGAEILFERILLECPLFAEREAATGEHYLLRVDRAHKIPLKPERELVLQELVEEGDLLLEELRLPSARGRVLWKHGMTLVTRQRISEGLAEVEQGVALLPNLLWAHYELVDTLLKVADFVKGLPSGTVAEGTVPFIEMEAWKHADYLRAQLEGSNSERDRSFRHLYLEMIRRAAGRKTDWRTIAGALDGQAQLEVSEAAREKLLDDLDAITADIDYIFARR